MDKTTGKSITILEEKVVEYFSRKRSEKITIFCDNCDVVFHKSDVLNLCFFGAALKDLFFVSILPKNSNIKIWVLNPSMAKRLEFFIGIDEKFVGVIDRYELFPMGSDLSPFPKLNESVVIDFVFAARASKLKNFDFICQALKGLESLNIPFRLHICGPYFKKENFDRFINLDSNKLEYHGDLGTTWTKTLVKKLENPCLIHLATDPVDDFCVSLAQWQEEGLPAIVPKLGPYKYLKGENICKIDSSIVMDKDTTALIEAIKQFCDSNTTKEEKSLGIREPEAISKSDLINMTNKVPANVKKELILLNQNVLSEKAIEVLNVN